MNSFNQNELMDQLKEMETFISSNMNTFQKDRNKLKEKIEQLDNRLQNAIKRIPNKPKESGDQLIRMLERLDYNHTTTSQTSAEERKFMQERDKIMLKQKQVAEYNEAQLEIDKMKIALSDLRKEIKITEKNIDQLKVSERINSIAIKLKCPMDDIKEDKITIPSEKVPQVIGKKFANLKKIEADTLVSIITEKNSGCITIVGNPTSIGNAKKIIESIVDSAIEDISPPEETIVCLLFNKAALVDEIQRKCSVRVDISRASKLCKISGKLDCIAAAKREINLIDCARSTINITATMLPFILGKGGSTIKGLGEGKTVQIDISKEHNFIIILGLRSHVELVTSTLHDIISENKEVEEVIVMPKYILLGACSGTNTCRNLSKEFGASILLDDKNGSITIRGVTSKVLQAKFHLTTLLSSYQRHTLSIKVDEQFLAWIVGKGGKNINELRKKYQGAAHIDILESYIHINSTSPDTQKEILDYINNVIDSKYSKEIPFDEDLSITLKSQKGASIRKKITDDLKITIDIGTNNQVLKLRGIKANVDLAIAELGEFAKKYHCEELSISDSDIVALKDGGDVSIIKKVEADCSVEINIKKDGILKVRGVKEAVDKAKSTIIGILGGDSNHGSALLHCISTASYYIIGKDGKNLKKLENDNGVKIDVIRAENKVRLRGPPECISKATIAITKFIDELKVTLTVSVESYTKNFNMSALIEEISALYDVEAVEKDNEIHLKGLAYLVEEAKKFIQSKTALTIDYTIPLKGHQMTSLRNVTIARSLRGIMDRNNVVISTDEQNMLLLIRGAGNNVIISKFEVIKVLSNAFPSEFLLMELELSCLKYVASPKAAMEIEDVTSAKLFIDRGHSCVCLIGDSNSVINAAQKIKDNQKYWEKLHAIFDIEEFMLPAIVGKQGSNIIALQKETESTIKINRKLMQLEVTGTSIDKITKAKLQIQSKIDKLRKEHWECEIPSAVLKLFIGKHGANINKMREESGANIDTFDKASTTFVKVTGNESSVLLAKEMIVSFIEKELQKNFQVDMPIPADAIGLIVGAKGVRIKEIHDDSGAKIELDKVKNIITIKGTPESCAKAENIINKILDDAGYNEPEPVVNEEEDEDAVIDNESKLDNDVIITGKFGRLPPGATQEMIAKLQEQSLSKSALRRKRRKEKQWKEEDKNIDDNASQFDYNEVYSSGSKDEISYKNSNALSLSSLVQKSDNTFSTSLIPGPIVTHFNFDDKSSGGSSNSTSPKNGVGIIGSPRATTSTVLGSMNTNTNTNTNTNNSTSTDSSALGNVGVSSILDYHSKDVTFISPPGLPQPSYLSMPTNNNSNNNSNSGGGTFNIKDSNKIQSSNETTNDGYFTSKAGFSIRL